nr:hypothetical protein [bacterium]
PGLLCQGLAIAKDDNGTYLLGDPRKSGIWLYRPQGYKLPPIKWSRRVGLGFYEELDWRARWASHTDVSKGRPNPARKPVL